MGDFFKGERGLEKAACCFVCGKFQFECLTSQSYRHGEEVRLNGLVADIDNPMPDLVWGAGEKHTFQTPEGEKYHLLIFGGVVRQYVAKMTIGLKIGIHTAVFAAE